MDYSDREVAAAGVNELSKVRTADGWIGVTADVGFDLAGRGSSGPAVNVALSVDFPQDGQLDTARRDALLAAVAVLKRIAAEPEDRLIALLEASSVAPEE